jgi:uncharacterized paraquat-inducible protein A
LTITNDFTARPQVPKCPNCGSRLEYARINVAKHFSCPDCENKLMVSETYTSRWRVGCYILTVVICSVLALRSVFFLLLAPLILFFVGLVTSIAIKRIFPPTIEDVAIKSHEARYIPL